MAPKENGMTKDEMDWLLLLSAAVGHSKSLATFVSRGCWPNAGAPPPDDAPPADAAPGAAFVTTGKEIGTPPHPAPAAWRAAPQWIERPDARCDGETGDEGRRPDGRRAARRGRRAARRGRHRAAPGMQRTRRPPPRRARRRRVRARWTMIGGHAAGARRLRRPRPGLGGAGRAAARDGGAAPASTLRKRLIVTAARGLYWIPEPRAAQPSTTDEERARLAAMVSERGYGLDVFRLLENLGAADRDSVSADGRTAPGDARHGARRLARHRVRAPPTALECAHRSGPECRKRRRPAARRRRGGEERHARR